MTIFDIDENYDIENIKVNGLSFWPFLRIYLGYVITTKKDGQVKVDKSNRLHLVKSLFYGFFNFFKKTDYIFMSSSDQKKLINSKYVDRIDYFIDYLDNENHLILELPNPKHHKIKDLTSKRISSKIWIYLLEKFYSIFITLNIENEDIITTILEDNNIEIDYKSLAKKMISQYKVSKIFFKWKKPKILFLTTSYTNMLRIKAAKKMGVKVVEFQHGIISKSHIAYNVNKSIDNDFYPDYLLTFGSKEKDIFDIDNKFIDRNKVLSLGSFYIDYLQKAEIVINSKILKIKKKHKKIVSFSCQDPFDKISIPFIIKAAKMDKDIAYLLMPRREKKAFFDSYNLPKNIYFVPELNTYEKILQTDIHSTLFSTTAIEALSLGKPNILLNIDNLPTKHFKNIIDDNEFTFYVETPVEFLKLIKSLPKFKKNDVINSNRSNITPNFRSNIKYIIETIEK